MKKIALMMFLTIAIIFAGSQVNQAEAREVYVGTYSDGTAVYLLTQTVQKFAAGRAGAYECDVRAGRDYIHYRFEADSEGWHYRNSEGYRDYIHNGRSPIAENILNFLRSNY